MNAKQLIKILKKQKNSTIAITSRDLTEITVRFQQLETGEWFIVLEGSKPSNNDQPLTNNSTNQQNIIDKDK